MDDEEGINTSYELVCFPLEDSSNRWGAKTRNYSSTRGTARLQQCFAGACGNSLPFRRHVPCAMCRATLLYRLCLLFQSKFFFGTYTTANPSLLQRWVHPRLNGVPVPYTSPDNDPCRTIFAETRYEGALRTRTATPRSCFLYKTPPTPSQRLQQRKRGEQREKRGERERRKQAPNLIRIHQKIK